MRMVCEWNAAGVSLHKREWLRAPQLKWSGCVSNSTSGSHMCQGLTCVVPWSLRHERRRCAVHQRRPAPLSHTTRGGGQMRTSQDVGVCDPLCGVCHPARVCTVRPSG